MMIMFITYLVIPLRKTVYVDYLKFYWMKALKNTTETQVRNNQPVGVCLKGVHTVFPFPNVYKIPD